MVKRQLSAILAMSFLATPAALAQQWQGGPGQPPHPPQAHGPAPGMAGPGMHGPGPGMAGPGMHGPGPAMAGPGMHGPGPAMAGPGMHGPGPAMAGPGMRGPGPTVWRRGDRFNVPPGQRRVVNDWHHHHGLYAPPAGYQWVQYNNQYMLVAITSGIIGAILGATAAYQ